MGALRSRRDRRDGAGRAALIGDAVGTVDAGRAAAPWTVGVAALFGNAPLDGLALGFPLLAQALALGFLLLAIGVPLTLEAQAFFLLGLASRPRSASLRARSSSLALRAASRSASLRAFSASLALRAASWAASLAASLALRAASASLALRSFSASLTLRSFSASLALRAASTSLALRSFSASLALRSFSASLALRAASTSLALRAFSASLALRSFSASLRRAEGAAFFPTGALDLPGRLAACCLPRVGAPALAAGTPRVAGLLGAPARRAPALAGFPADLPEVLGLAAEGRAAFPAFGLGAEAPLAGGFLPAEARAFAAEAPFEGALDCAALAD